MNKTKDIHGSTDRRNRNINGARVKSPIEQRVHSYGNINNSNSLRRIDLSNMLVHSANRQVIGPDFVR